MSLCLVEGGFTRFFLRSLERARSGKVVSALPLPRFIVEEYRVDDLKMCRLILLGPPKLIIPAPGPSYINDDEPALYAEEMHVRIRAEVKPTEDEEKLLRAIKKIFPEVEFRLVQQQDRRFFIGESSEISSLKYVKENWRRRKVRSTAARLLREAARPGVVYMRLSKQAAYVGVASILDFDEEPAIGSIEVEVETSDPEELIKWMTT